HRRLAPAAQPVEAGPVRAAGQEVLVVPEPPLARPQPLPFDDVHGQRPRRAGGGGGPVPVLRGGTRQRRAQRRRIGRGRGGEQREAERNPESGGRDQRPPTAGRNGGAGGNGRAHGHDSARAPAPPQHTNTPAGIS